MNSFIFLPQVAEMISTVCLREKVSSVTGRITLTDKSAVPSDIFRSFTNCYQDPEFEWMVEARASARIYMLQ